MGGRYNAVMPRSAYAFDPTRHVAPLTAIFRDLAREREAGRVLDERCLDRILRRHPKDGRGFYSRAELLRGLRHLARHRPEVLPSAGEAAGELTASLAQALRKKPVRSLSGVTVVTVLTRPHPCPGRCVFCPSDVRMPKSYLSDEPGSQRAASHGFDPYRQTFARLLALHRTGHPVDKVELMVLGGTWSSYPAAYQRWFLERCFTALNDFGAAVRDGEPRLPGATEPRVDFRLLEDSVDGRRVGGDAADGAESLYNRRVARHLRSALEGGLEDLREGATWDELFAAQRLNETAGARCVGLVLETRPDRVDAEEVLRLRRLGATRIQLGVQSLCDEVLRRNRRGHDVATARRAFGRLRRAGFKIVAHWMPNLLGSTPERDRRDFDRLFADSDFRPDELKIYPCSLVESAELMRHWRSGAWRPYSERELLGVLTYALPRVPPYCRVTRVVRDIPGTDIVSGNRVTNFRQVVTAELARRAVPVVDIRAREIRHREVAPEAIRVEELRYDAGTAREVFLQGVVEDGERRDRLVGFLRLSLPREDENGAPAELSGCARIREVHVYGAVAGLGEEGDEPATRTAQHSGLGRRLIERAAALAAAEGYPDLAVISAVGTREYYRRRGFRDGELYQHRETSQARLPGRAQRAAVTVR